MIFLFNSVIMRAWWVFTLVLSNLQSHYFHRPRNFKALSSGSLVRFHDCLSRYFGWKVAIAFDCYSNFSVDRLRQIFVPKWSGSKARSHIIARGSSLLH